MLSIVEQLENRYCSLDSKYNEMIHRMFLKLKEHCDDWPADKTGRWIGFIQGVLFAEGLLDINTERDFTRPLFHAYYRENGIEIPPSVEA